MILQFIKNTASNYGGQFVSMLVFSFIVFAYISGLGFNNPLETLS